MTEREKMLAGELYDCGDAELLSQWHKAKDLIRDYNQADSADADKKEEILSKLLGGKGKNLWITAPLYSISSDKCQGSFWRTERGWLIRIL